MSAWSPDTTCKPEPITGGYRLALSYHLLRETRASRPSIFCTDTNLFQGIRGTLLTWRDSAETDPQKIILLLEHNYPEDRLQPGSLKGADAHKLAIFRTLAAQLGFQVGLVKVTISLDGYGALADAGGSEPLEFDEEDETDAGGSLPLEFNEEDEPIHRAVSASQFIDLEGRTIEAVLPYNPATETIPIDLTKGIEHESHDLQKWYQYVSHFCTLCLMEY